MYRIGAFACVISLTLFLSLSAGRASGPEKIGQTPPAVVPILTTNPATIYLPSNKPVTLNVKVQSTYDTDISAASTAPIPPPPYKVTSVYLNRVTVVWSGTPIWNAVQTNPSPATISVGDPITTQTQPPSATLGAAKTFTTGAGVQTATVFVDNMNPDANPPYFEKTRLWTLMGTNSITVYSEGHPTGDPYNPAVPPLSTNLDLDINDVVLEFTW